MARSVVWGLTAGAVLATAFTALAAHGEELASIGTHSQRYGTHIGISAYEDPLLKGVACYLSGSHDDGNLGGSAKRRMSDVVVSCHQVATLSVPVHVPRQAQVFDESVDPVFKTVHVVRILDPKRHAVLYFAYTEAELAGNLPGHVDVIRLPPPNRLETR
ncbi:CreA family protein [Paraburkholderia sp. A2WS-5]|uniref:CreA family protein n=1 Tax=unclassified Paraburkholderia TaxID=2615204 RepID=UPI003B7F5DFA